MMWNLYRNFLLHYWKHIKGGKGSHLAIVIVGKLVFFYASKETSAEWTIWYDANTQLPATSINIQMSPIITPHDHLQKSRISGASAEIYTWRLQVQIVKSMLLRN